jgi:hypothetical protein
MQWITKKLPRGRLSDHLQAVLPSPPTVVPAPFINEPFLIVAPVVVSKRVHKPFWRCLAISA